MPDIATAGYIPIFLVVVCDLYSVQNPLGRRNLMSDEDVQSKRETEDRLSLRLYFAAVACAIAAIVAVAIGMGGLFVLPPMATTVCRWIAVWGMVGYVMLSFAFSRASERMGKRRVLASRVVVALVVLVVMMGFVGVADALG